MADLFLQYLSSLVFSQQAGQLSVVIHLETLTLFQPGGGVESTPSRFFPRHRHKNQPIDSKLSDF